MLIALIHLLFVLPANASRETGDQAQSAQNPPQSYQVYVYPVPNLVERVGDNTYVGLEVELWKEIAQRNDIDYRFVEVESLDEVLASLRNRKADFALGALTIHNDRAKHMSFSQPYLSGGISALLRDDGIDFITSLKTLLSGTVLKVAGLYFAFCCVFGLIFWWLERRNSDSEIRQPFILGNIDGFWHAFKKPWNVQSPVSRLLVFPLWIVSMLFSSLITAQVIHSLSFAKEETRFAYEDWSTDRLGVLKGSITETLANKQEERFAEVQRFNTNEDMYLAFRDKQIDAIAADEPVLIEFDERAERDALAVLHSPKPFAEAYYAIGISYNIDWRQIRKIDQTIMQLRDIGFIHRLRQKWLPDA